MKNIRGIYQCDFRQKIIHINNSLDPCMQCQVCAHELGHALLHKKTNTIFMDRHTYILTNKFEIEANMFAAELLVSNESIIEYKDYPISHVASILGIEEMLVEYKINLMKNEFYI